MIRNFYLIQSYLVRLLVFLLILTLTPAARPLQPIAGNRLPRTPPASLLFFVPDGETLATYTARGEGYMLQVSPSGASFALRHPADSTYSFLTMALVNASPPASVLAQDKLRRKMHYFIGNDPQHWRQNVSGYGKIRYTAVYPGIDVVYYGNDRTLEYDFVLAPGADSQGIVLQFGGADSLRTDDAGDLLVYTQGQMIRQHKPFAYQEIRQQIREIPCRYLVSADNRVTFTLGTYDPSKQLIIDPVLAYSSYLGGTAQDRGNGIAADAEGNFYVTGSTLSANFPTRGTVGQTTRPGTHEMAFLTKFNRDSEVLYSVYLGGARQEVCCAIPQNIAHDVAVDKEGFVYLTGSTTTPDFPTTAGTFQSQYQGRGDAFVTKISPDGTQLVYSTHIGSRNEKEEGWSIAVDSIGQAYVTGRTSAYSQNTFPVKNEFGHTGTIFLSKLDADGKQLLYSTQLGSADTWYDNPHGIAIDNLGNAYIHGSARQGLPVSKNAFQKEYKGGFSDGFVAKFNTTLSGRESLVYCTYLGGVDTEGGNPHSVFGAITVGPDGSAYVAGITTSWDFPFTSGAFKTEIHNRGDAYITRLSPDGSSLLFSTALGGAGGTGEIPVGIALDSLGNVYVAGWGMNGLGNDFPLRNSYQASGGSWFITQFTPDGSDILYSSRFGGRVDGSTFGIGDMALDAQGNIYLTGATGANDFPVTDNAFQKSFGGSWDAFVIKVVPNTATADFTFVADGQRVFFTNQSVNALRYEWEFGDGQQSSQTNPTHTYAAPGLYKTCLTAFENGGSTTHCREVGLKGIQSISPQVGGATGHARVQVYGFGFRDGSIVRLSNGQTTFQAQSTLPENSAQLLALFKFDNAALGVYDLIVSTPGQAEDTLRNAFTIQPVTNFDPWAQVTGPKFALINRPTAYRIAYGTNSNSVAFAVPLYISVSGAAKVELLNEVFLDEVDPEIVEALPASHFYEVKDSLSGESIQFAALLLPYVQPGGTQYINLRVTPVINGKTEIITGFGDSILDEEELAGAGLRVATACNFLPKCFQCLLDAASFVPVEGCVPSLGSVGCSIGNFYNSPGFGAALDFVGELSGFALSCSGLKGVGVVLQSVANLVSNAAGGMALSSCGECATRNPKQGWLEFEAVGSLDPNIKIGPPGSTDHNYITGENPLHYRIYYENVDSATAPANEVYIVDQLDTTVLNLRTLMFTEFGFGDSLYYLSPEGGRFSTDIDLRPAKNIILRVSGSLDTTTGVLTSKFSSFDPQTMDLTDEVMEGFLPPNKTSPEGEGYIGFSIRAKPNLPHLTSIRNEALIYFDVNEPIETPVWVNTIDREAPTSRVSPVTDIRSDSTFMVRWSGTDAHAGILDYTIYVSEEDGPFQPWIYSIRQDSALFTGVAGRKYSFYSEARDRVGNLERKSPLAEATFSQVTSLEPLANVNRWNLIVRPNPFSQRAEITFQLPKSTHVQLTLVDVLGRKVSVLVNKPMGTGAQVFEWMPAVNLPEGLYFLRLQTPEGGVTQRMIYRRQE